MSEDRYSKYNNFNDSDVNLREAWNKFRVKHKWGAYVAETITHGGELHQNTPRLAKHRGYRIAGVRAK